MTSSIGSRRVPSSAFLYKTRGRETVISKPSRRIVSINTPSCNSPRPPISKASRFALSVKVIATLVSASANKRSRITVEVTFLPSRPARGESFTVMLTDMVGGSIGVERNGSVTAGTQMVSDTELFVRPAIQTMSPAVTLSTGTRAVPSNRSNFVNRPVSTT